MELSELKAKWNEMDSRLSNLEIINRNVVRELTAMKTASALSELKRSSWQGAFTTIIVSAVMTYFFGHNEEIGEIMNPYSIIAIIAVMVIGSIYTLYRALSISKIDVTMPTAELMKRTNKVRRALELENLASYIMVAVLYVVVFALESQRWIAARGKIIPAIILLIGLCALVTCVFFAAKKRNKAMLDKIDSNLKELSKID